MTRQFTPESAVERYLEERKYDLSDSRQDSVINLCWFCGNRRESSVGVGNAASRLVEVLDDG